jgi:hypothetical protein
MRILGELVADRYISSARQIDIRTGEGLMAQRMIIALIVQPSAIVAFPGHLRCAKDG